MICALTPVLVSADSPRENIYQYESPNGYYVNTLVASDKKRVVGFQFYGLYFGAGIPVSVNLYSQNGLTIDFAINETSENLSEGQKAVKTRVIGLFDYLNNIIVTVDSLANTQYGGQIDGMPVSDVFKYNNYKNYVSDGKSLKIDKHTYEMLKIAKEMYSATNGDFNPAVYRLVDLWGFSSRTYLYNGNLPYDRTWSEKELSYPLPAQEYVEAFSKPEFVDFSDDAVKLSEINGEYFVTKNVPSAQVNDEVYEQWIDLGGIAKGYVVDLIKQYLDEQGLNEFYADAGSSSLAFGREKNGLVVSDPFSPLAALGYGDALLSFNVEKSSVSTSGQYIRKYVTDGVEYAHIIDGKYGAPAQTGVKSVTVVAPEGNFWAGKSDCLTTALTVMGKDGIIGFMNGYLKDNGITVVVAYETVDGKKQILTNLAQTDVIDKGPYYDEFAWSVSLKDGVYSYDFNAKAPKSGKSDLLWLYITLSVAAVSAVVGIIVYHFVKGKKNVTANIINAKRDKPFKLGDVGVYLAVAVVIVALFVGFFGGDGASDNIRVINVVDMTKSAEGEILFTYNVARNEFIAYEDNDMGWKIRTEYTDKGLKVTFSREIDGENHFNVMEISRGTKPSVKMTDSVCGRNQECVKNFPAVTRPKGSIVCSPNHLKIVTV